MWSTEKVCMSALLSEKCCTLSVSTDCFPDTVIWSLKIASTPMIAESLSCKRKSNNAERPLNEQGTLRKIPIICISDRSKFFSFAFVKGCNLDSRKYRYSIKKEYGRMLTSEPVSMRKGSKNTSRSAEILIVA